MKSIYISEDEKNRIKKQRRINKYLANVQVSRDRFDPNSYYVRSGSTNKNYLVYFSIQKQKFLCDCIHYALKQTECIHIKTIKSYNEFLAYTRASEIARIEKPIIHSRTYSLRTN